MKDKRPYDQLIFGPRTFDIKEFEEMGRAAKDAGFTHLYISGLSERTDWMGDDEGSPWCEWATSLPSVFKHVSPPGLENAHGPGFVKRQMAWMKKKHAVCAKLGMRGAAYFGNEPHFLCERVYAKHPDWRGARCDNSLRTIGMFFAPNIDHPEVREAYRLGMKIIAKECPLIDTFSFNTNDSGGGFIWGATLYVNPNGPTGYENRDMGVRVTEFLSLLRQGAIDGGAKNARVYQDLWFTTDEKYLVTRSLKPGIGSNAVVKSDDPEIVRECSLSYAGNWGMGGGVNMEPFINEFPAARGIVGAAAFIKSGKVGRFHAGGKSMEYFKAFKLAMEKPAAKTPSEKLDVLLHMAAGMYAPDVAEDVVEAWDMIERAGVQAHTVGADNFHGPVMLRWLIRPLVALQELLTEAELSYWRRRIYQSEKCQPDGWLDYANVMGSSLYSTWEGAMYAAIGIDYVEGTLASAAAMFKAASEKTSNRKAAKDLLVTHYRVMAARCVYKTTRHFAQFAALIKIRDADINTLAERGETLTTVRPEQPDLPKGNAGSNGLFFMHRALRWELDNTNELIQIIKNCPETIFNVAPDDEREGALLLGPDLIGKLQKKVNIMLKHWRETETGWYRPTLGG